MKPKLWWSAGAALGLLVVPLIVLAAEPTESAEPAPRGAEIYDVDPVHTSLWFRIKHLNVAYFYGRFNDVSGTFAFDDSDPTQNRFDITAQATSIDTAHKGRDDHLRSEEFFAVEKHPTITFQSRSVKALGKDEFEVEGALTLRGITKPLTVKLERTGRGPGMRGEYRSGFETTFTIKRTDFGMDALLPALGDEVRLTVAVEGIRK